ncbi:OmpA family protein [Paenibacillus camelliae]|uniref:OmpA family protein n=1 Tax=Paenibacillus camelliae TaxID=512410 RepID=UPI00203C8246|nr:OmpA family protein [Paenibacillus camelliae]MCM3634287.1 OmpA family protein [Paenibacillus camelliae]
MRNKYRRTFGLDKEEGNFWPTFTDLFASIILFLLIIMAIYNGIHSKKLNSIEEKYNETHTMIENSFGINTKIVEALKVAFEKEDIAVMLDEKTGQLTFTEKILFETDSATLTSEFKKELDRIVPVYFSVLFNEEYRSMIGSIVVEGHTDDVGNYFSNLDLSQRRAFSVVRYILSEESVDFPEKLELRTILSANGRSFMDLKYEEDGVTVDRAASRRVEIKFQINDEETLKEIQRYLQQSKDQ